MIIKRENKTKKSKNQNDNIKNKEIDWNIHWKNYHDIIDDFHSKNSKV
ncbi:MAG: hypothetical protein ACMXYG_04040 [Candidatus Woesearchaeota archaeon]